MFDVVDLFNECTSRCCVSFSVTPAFSALYHGLDLILRSTSLFSRIMHSRGSVSVLNTACSALPAVFFTHLKRVRIFSCFLCFLITLFSDVFRCFHVIILYFVFRRFHEVATLFVNHVQMSRAAQLFFQIFRFFTFLLIFSNFRI